VAKLILGITNKNYSSWSLRPWMALTEAGIPFEEELIRLDLPDFRKRTFTAGGQGKVPFLKHGTRVVWESLAVMEYLAEQFPEKKLWPASVAARAMARSVSNEMHAGFGALRNACPMNLRRPVKPVPFSDAVKADIARIEAVWRTCRTTHGKGGKFLFGRFSIADAMYAPVVSRFETYAVPVSKASREYMDAVLGSKAFKAWSADASKEPWIVPEDEVD
jgi:glutathione S-transferase